MDEKNVNVTKQPGKLYQDEKKQLSEQKRALLVTASLSLTEEQGQEYLKELTSLANTFGLECVHAIAIKLREIDPGTYLKSGKIEEIHELAQTHDAEVIIFDDEIAPSQQRGLEKLLKIPVIDRTELILEIFSNHARTKEAKIQIELAKCTYQLPRLKRLWTHLSRQRSGGGGGSAVKGEGERQIEIDRRLIRARQVALRRELKDVRAQRALQRHARKRNAIPTFGIVGYTNVGKSTLINTLTDCGVLAEDKLFATLDTTTRQFILPNKDKVLLVDTVGFIRKIPHTLIDAFTSTLEEAVYTDALIHVVDISHPAAINQAEETLKVLGELGAKDKTIITVLNKVDQLENKQEVMRFKLKYTKVVAISAKTGQGVDDLLAYIEKVARGFRQLCHLRVPQKEYKVVSKLMEKGSVLELDYEESDVCLTVEIPLELKGLVEPFLVDKKE